MEAALLAAVLLLMGTQARLIQQEIHVLPAQPVLPSISVLPALPEFPAKQDSQIQPILPASVQLPQETSTVLALGGGRSGGVQVTGMLQNFALDQDPLHRLLNRPRTSYLDLTWSNWVDERMELLDLFQELIAPPDRPLCPHMKSTSALDTGMVSYLASSRFGPAILTTYAEQAGDEQMDFDYDSVDIPTDRPLQRSYEDAFLQEEMSADADKAFEMAALESGMHSQESKIGYFGANLKSQDQAGWETDYRNSPIILTRANLDDLVGMEQVELEPQPLSREPKMGAQEPIDRKQLALFILLLAGCCYVWTNLLISCIRLKRQGDERRQAADDFLILPLTPEKAGCLGNIQIASDYLPAGKLAEPLSV